VKSYAHVFMLVASVVSVGRGNLPALAQGAGGGAPQGREAAPPGGAPAGRGRAPLPTFDTSKPAKLDLVEAKGRYRVQEQLVGLSVLSDAVGTIETVTGTLVFAPDGTFASPSRITVDLKSLRSDQDLRDNYLRGRVLETDKFPNLEFVPKRAQGLQTPLPSPPQVQVVGFQLIGDMSLHGVTKETTWNVVATLAGATVAGRATTTALFQTYNLMKPVVPFVLSSDDKIQLEVEFKCNRSAL
jgi:polyisoprenoid-binding protein YceI